VYLDGRGYDSEQARMKFMGRGFDSVRAEVIFVGCKFGEGG
jgi:hypothetical protein